MFLSWLFTVNSVSDNCAAISLFDAPPAGASLVFVIRDGAGIVPERTTSLRTGDDLLIVVTRADRRRTEDRLRAVSRSGRLARFYGDVGDPDAR